LPLEIAERRQDLMDQLAAAEESRRLAAAALADGEQALAAADRIVKEAEQSLAQAREERVRRQAAVAAAAQAGQGLAERIRERLQISPEQLAEEVGEVDPGQADTLQRQFDKLSQEREALGPVNLRAEEEVAELEAQMEVLKTERDDLVAAIAKLRQAIAEINREGRQRLLASFEAVDQHFRDLFVRLFGGGRAHLTLTESNDPLQAGLEIMASPPGKRLQILSLLSGGEQALTALSLLFAVFMTNPAPICVLDEVDAPLDDANVDRFCSLVSEIAEASKTRFLVVTHHRMTMARMDRLYGVTMAERGVSTLVSVDLKTAEKLRDA
jgi:chromosome segregation protein